MRSGRWLAAGAMVVLCGVAVAAVTIFDGPSAEELVREARAALQAERPAESRALAERALQQSPELVRALVTAGEAATALGKPRDALAYYRRIKNDGSADVTVGLGAAADLLVKLGQLSEAEDKYRQLLELRPDNLLAHRRLAAILVLVGRRRESEPHLLKLLRAGDFTIDELALLGNVEQIFDNPEAVEHFRRLAPDDPFPLLGAARIEIRRNETERAADLLREVVAAVPDHMEARAQLGRVLVELGDEQEFHQWHAALPLSAGEVADIWATRGLWAQKQNEPDAAIRCYWEAVRRDPNHWKANYQLSQVLLAEGEHESAQGFLERAERLNKLAEAVRWILINPERVELMLEAATLTESLGRPWEAWGWYHTVNRLQAGRTPALRERDRLAKQLRADTPRTLPTANPALAIDLSYWPLPNWLLQAPGPYQSPRHATTGDPQTPALSFVDLADSAELRFSYHNGTDPDAEGLRMWESFGGGVAVLDYDGDGWPDLHFTQGCDWPPQAGKTQYVDCLFRNRGDGRLVEVTLQAGVADDRYSQGCTVGDFTSDGFPDLYVANIGLNRLYRNNGDGTFSDVTDESGIRGEFWTSSCVLADLNGDGLPDLYDVNYLAGRAPFEKICINEETQLPRACAPTHFPGEQDVLYLNLGNGGFEDISSAAGITIPDGKGLGVVAADLDGSGRLDLYVANDTTPNFYFVNRTERPGSVPSFSEEAVLRGCAFDVEGRAQAGMGIAFGDVNGDGSFDLFVTNFYNEYNALYVQQPSGLFTDASADSGLKQPSVLMLGFGTQFLDADLDSCPDVVVANGHVDDFRFQGKAFAMRPQVFSNRGNGRFVEIRGESVGTYFANEWLGRGLARLDWNRDGLEDFAVSHLQAPAALVTNRTPDAGHFLALRFSGTASSRDAIGTVVRLNAGGRTRIAQLSAGDGYFASNQRQLVFGLGETDRVDELVVRWPSGLEQSFVDLPADSELFLIEGRSQPLRVAAP